MTEPTGDGSSLPPSPMSGAPTSKRVRGPLVDHGAIVAAWVGLGMAVTIGVSFLLVIPIEPIYWLLTPLAGLLIGYYANQRSLTPRAPGAGSWPMPCSPGSSPA